MTEAMTVGPGRTVELHYSLRLDDATEVASSRDDQPLRFTVGDGTLVEGLERFLYGLGAGDRRTFQVAPEDAYGAHDPSNIQMMPLDQFAGMELEPGFIIGFDTPSGEELPGTILAVGDDGVQVDFNHPLAGRNLVFEAEVVAVT